MVSQPYLLIAARSYPALVLRACCGCLQAGSKRVLNAKSDKFQGNIHKRGKVQDVSPVSCFGFAQRDCTQTAHLTIVVEVGCRKAAAKSLWAQSCLVSFCL